MLALDQYHAGISQFGLTVSNCISYVFVSLNKDITYKRYVIYMSN